MVANGPLIVTQRLIGPAQAVQDDAFAAPVLDYPAPRQGLLKVANGPLILTQCLVSPAQIVQGGAFAHPVSDLPPNGQNLLVGHDGVRVVTVLGELRTTLMPHVYQGALGL